MEGNTEEDQEEVGWMILKIGLESHYVGYGFLKRNAENIMEISDDKNA